MRTAMIGMLIVTFVAGANAQSKKKPVGSPENAKDDSTTTVVAEGLGATKDAALKDAFRNAVRQVVGAVIDAETLVKNDEVISDKVLTYSDGFVTKYDEIGKKNENDLIRIKIRAIVERRKIVAKLKELNVTVKSVEGKDLAASATTRKEARENAAALLSNQLVELPKVLAAEARKPTARDYDEDKGELKLDITVDAPADTYKTFLKKLVDSADKVCVSKYSVTFAGEVKASNMTSLHKPGEQPFRYFSEIVAHKNVRPALSQSVFVGPDLKDTPKAWCLWICTQADTKGGQCRWTCYIVDCIPAQTLPCLKGELVVSVSLLDKAGEVLSQHDIDLDATDSSSWGWLGAVGHRTDGIFASSGALIGDHMGRDRSKRTYADIEERRGAERNFFVRIAPFCMGLDSNGNRALAYRPQVNYPLKIKLTEKELSQLKDVKCAVVFKPADPKIKTKD